MRYISSRRKKTTLSKAKEAKMREKTTKPHDAAILAKEEASSQKEADQKAFLTLGSGPMLTKHRTNPDHIIPARHAAFLKEFVNNGGNATRAAMKVFKTSNYNSAASLGQYYLKSSRSAIRVYLEERGFTLGKLLDFLTKKMEESKTPEWFDRLMKLADYEDFFHREQSPGKSVVNIIQTEKDILNKYVDGEVEEPLAFISPERKTNSRK